MSKNQKTSAQNKAKKPFRKCCEKQQPELPEKHFKEWLSEQRPESVRRRIRRLGRWFGAEQPAECRSQELHSLRDSVALVKKAQIQLNK